MPDKAYIHSSIYRSELSYFHTFYFYLLLAASHLGSILPPSLCLPLKQISTCHQVDVAIHKLLLLLLLRLLTQQQQQQQRALSCLTIKVRPLPTPHGPPLLLLSLCSWYRAISPQSFQSALAAAACYSPSYIDLAFGGAVFCLLRLCSAHP